MPRLTDCGDAEKVKVTCLKMFSFLKKVVSSVLLWGSDPLETGLEEDEQAILNKIKQMNYQERGILENPSNLGKTLNAYSEPVQFEVETLKCVHKTGRVTHLCEEYGLIDNVVYFERNQVSPGLILKVDDEVVYSAYKAIENEAERVYKVYALKNDPSDFGDSLEVTSGLNKIEEISALSRVITGRVTKRKGREVYIESADIWCNLDSIHASYIPVEGDWVELQAVVTVDEEVENLSGDILEIKSLKPLLLKSGFGRVTFWSESSKEGAIENLIYFTHIACGNGYIPSLGDQVTYDAVESDQERFRWRALVVLRDNVTKSKSEGGVLNGKKMSEAFLSNDMSKEINGISIKPSMCAVEVELHQKKIVTLEMNNDGDSTQLLLRTRFQNKIKNSQLKLVSPQKGNLYISPKQTVIFQLECEGKLLGLHREKFTFHFNDFEISKEFEVNVTGNKEMNSILNCNFDTVFKGFNKKPEEWREKEHSFVLYGPRPWKLPKFINKGQKCVFNIPKQLLALAGKDKLRLKDIFKYAPYLKGELNFAQYADRFHTLLYLEEIELKSYFRQFSMKEVFLRRSEDYFVLEVPGLVEKRPSLIIGDKIVLVQAWSETKHVGFVHDIREREVFIKFNSSFHNSYDESECDVSFEPNTNFFSKTHFAVHRAGGLLGEQWLFPSAVNEKAPQIDLRVLETEEKLSKNVANFFEQLPKNQTRTQLPEICDVKEVESSIRDGSKKSLSWVNKKLNERQKLAVLSVLRGQGRPLPYIIFGPPGTGKTVTLVEIVVQLYRLMPDSRILISTPSNSSADLICERLIEMGNFKPGELVRLVAFYRVIEKLVPPKLVPYSTYYDTSGDLKRGNSRISMKKGIRSSSISKLAGRHRITVSTCSAIGALHYEGLPPGHFSHILVDEAGQTSEPEVLLSVTFQNIQMGQVVLTGDPQQLGPVICSSIAKKLGLGISLMQRLTSRFPYARDLDGFPETSGFDSRFITKLNINYRSVPEILSLPNQMFYNSDLIPTVSQTEGEEAKIIDSCNFRDEKRKTPAAIIFHAIIGQNYQEADSPSWFNPHEVWQVVFYLKKLYSVGLKSSDIGVVTPYSKQVQKLKYILQKLDMSAPKIASVEEFQGQERHVIIVSTVRSSPRHVSSDVLHSLGFVASPQRLNVALTRARAVLIIIGNPVLLSDDPYWVSVVRYCIKNNSFTGCKIMNLPEKCKVKLIDQKEDDDEA